MLNSFHFLILYSFLFSSPELQNGSWISQTGQDAWGCVLLAKSSPSNWMTGIQVPMNPEAFHPTSLLYALIVAELPCFQESCLPSARWMLILELLSSKCWTPAAILSSGSKMAQVDDAASCLSYNSSASQLTSKFHWLHSSWQSCWVAIYSFQAGMLLSVSALQTEETPSTYLWLSKITSSEFAADFSSCQWNLLHLCRLFPGPHRWVKREETEEHTVAEAEPQTKLDLGFKEGQTIRINFQVGERSTAFSQSSEGITHLLGWISLSCRQRSKVRAVPISPVRKQAEQEASCPRLLVESKSQLLPRPHLAPPLSIMLPPSPIPRKLTAIRHPLKATWICYWIWGPPPLPLPSNRITSLKQQRQTPGETLPLLGKSANWAVVAYAHS